MRELKKLLSLTSCKNGVFQWSKPNLRSRKMWLSDWLDIVIGENDADNSLECIRHVKKNIIKENLCIFVNYACIEFPIHLMISFKPLRLFIRISSNPEYASLADFQQHNYQKVENFFFLNFKKLQYSLPLETLIKFQRWLRISIEYFSRVVSNTKKERKERSDS